MAVKKTPSLGHDSKKNPVGTASLIWASSLCGRSSKLVEFVGILQ